MNSVKNLLNEEIANAIENLTVLKPGSEEYSSAIESIAKLCKARLDEATYELEQQQQARDRRFKNGMSIAELCVPLIFYAYWLGKGLKFEETGVFTSFIFKNLFTRFKPNKK